MEMLNYYLKILLTKLKYQWRSEITHGMHEKNNLLNFFRHYHGREGREKEKWKPKLMLMNTH